MKTRLDKVSWKTLFIVLGILLAVRLIVGIV